MPRRGDQHLHPVIPLDAPRQPPQPGRARSHRPAAQDLVDARLAELGDYVLEPVEVEPFIEKVDGVRFGWKVGRYDDGEHFIGIVPGDFIVYYAPWDGLDYDT